MYLRTPIPADSRVLTYARFSTDEQRQQSNADQSDYCQEFVREHDTKPRSIDVISDEGLSGELRSRPGIDRVREGIESRRWGLIIVEDSSRLYRGVAPCMDLVGLAVDQGIRVICINDGVDTANEDWQQRLEEAQRHHGQDNYYTRFRIKRAHEGLWRMGAAIGLRRPGYRRFARNPETPKSPKFDEIDPQWRSVISHTFQMVANLAPLEVAADYLTKEGLPKTSNARSSKWTARNVLSLIRCELYRGVEFYREETSKKEFRTGKSKSVRNPDPEKVLQRNMPHLRMVDDWLWHKANEVIDSRARPSVPISGQDHPLYGIPRDSRSLLSSIFVCDICGSKMYAEGRNEGGYRCSAARRGECWNKATCLRELTHERISTAVSDAILQMAHGTIDVLVGHIESLLTNRGHLHEEQRKLAKRRFELTLKQQRLLKFITDQDSPPDFLMSKQAELQSEEQRLRLDEQQLHSQLAERTTIPSREEIAERLQLLARTVKPGDQEARPLLRQLIEGPIRAIPFQPFGNSNVVLRAELTLQLVRLMPSDICLILNGTASAAIEQNLFRKPLILDLFIPSKPHQHALSALEIRRASPDRPPTLAQVGAQLGISKRAAHLALQLGRQMETAGLTDAFIRLSECPSNPARWRFKSAS